MFFCVYIYDSINYIVQDLKTQFYLKALQSNAYLTVLSWG